MTSGRFHQVLISSITIERTERQRQDLGDVDSLVESIARIGLINPIVITEDAVLVAGERRLTACTSLGWTHIPAQYTSELSYYELQSIELEENIKRKDLTWQEEVAALARFHSLKTENEEGWTQDDTAAAVGYSRQEINRRLLVAEQMDNPVVAEADRLSAAVNIVKRNAERKKTSAFANVGQVLARAMPTVLEFPNEDGTPNIGIVQPPTIPLLNTSFHDWQETYDGPKFNLIHCDFPYGINVADSPRMSSTIKDHYDDSPDVYWTLLARLALAMDNVVAESAHLIFWHSMKFFPDTVVELERMGWKVNPFPLIWHKADGAGIAPDPQRGPRQTYEAAIFASRGDRKITQEGCVANSIAWPGRRSDAIHISEKPYGMLRHFLRMICDEYSSALDPTCGSGNALKVAEDLGAASVLGIEQSSEFYEIARNNWEKRGEDI